MNGCSQGTAEIYQRGTGTRATYYLGNSGFEGSGSVSSGADVTLDSNGGAQVYVGELVTVVCKDSAGAEVRRFVAGAAAEAVEVTNTAFTGTAYVGGAVAAGNPTTLDAVLSKVLSSFGTTDFKVLLGGVATDLSAAFGTTLAGILFNVKDTAYGAVGNGVADDRAAIAAAITAAALVDGTVFFPPGTYKIDSGITVPYNVNLLGCGANASVIAPAHVSADHITLTGSASALRYMSIAGLTVKPGAASTGSLIVYAGSDILHVKISDCDLGGEDANDVLVNIASASNVTMEIHGGRLYTGTSALAVSAGANRLKMRDVFLKLNSGGSGQALSGLVLDVEGCYFDNTAIAGAGLTVATATPNIVASSSAAMDWRIVDNTFTAPGSNNVIALANAAANDVHADSVIHESGNVFGSSVFPYRIRWAIASKGAKCWLGSRVGRRVEATNNTATLALTTEPMFYETIVIKRSNNDDQTVSFAGSSGNYNNLPDGNYTTVMVWNESGGNIAAETFSFNGAGAAAAINDGLSATVHLKHMHVESECGPYAMAPVVATGDPL